MSDSQKEQDQIEKLEHRGRKRGRVVWKLIEQFESHHITPPSGLLLLAAQPEVSKRKWEYAMFKARADLAASLSQSDNIATDQVIADCEPGTLSSRLP